MKNRLIRLAEISEHKFKDLTKEYIVVRVDKIFPVVIKRKRKRINKTGKEKSVGIGSDVSSEKVIVVNSGKIR